MQGESGCVRVGATVETVEPDTTLAEWLAAQVVAYRKHLGMSGWVASDELQDALTERFNDALLTAAGPLLADLLRRLVEPTHDPADLRTIQEMWDDVERNPDKPWVMPDGTVR